MSTKNQLAKMQKLQKLEGWAKKNFKPQEYDTDVMTKILIQYCRSEFASSRGQASDYALTVQLRLLSSHMKRQSELDISETTPLPLESEANMTVEQILSDYHKRLPSPPKTDFPIQEED